MTRACEVDYFRAHPEKSWPILREIFYDNFGRAKPNKAHQVLAAWERDGWPHGAGSSGTGPSQDGLGRLQVLFTQNIDSVQ